MAAKVVTLKVPPTTAAEYVYLVEIAKGLARTLSHFLKNLTNMKGLPTIQYPEMLRNYSGRFRGRHILKKREDDTLKCVACYMCETACPAECIHIEAGEHPVLAYEKYPTVFEIDLLRCVYCGYCVDACPKDAIWMTRDYELSFFDRKSAVLGIPELTEKPSDTAAGGPGLRLPAVRGREPDEEGGGVRALGPPAPPGAPRARRRDQPHAAPSAAEAPCSGAGGEGGLSRKTGRDIHVR